MKDNLYTKEQAKALIISGIRRSAEAVGITMGTSGFNSIIEAIESPGYMTTNDGLTILSAIKFENPLEDLGRQILLEAVSRANKKNGDGSSSTCVLTAAIIEAGQKYSDFNPMEIKKSLEELVPFIENEIAKQKQEISIDRVGTVASISAEDKEIGSMIQEIYQKIGKDGIIHWDISKTGSDFYSIGNGITINGAGFISPYMCDIDEKSGQFLNVARWKNPKILLTRQKITSAAEFNELFASLNANEIKEVVVFCDEIEAPVISDLIKTRAVRGFKTLVIKMPVLWKDQWFEDIAIVSGAKIIDPNLGLTLKNAKIEHLGTVGNIIVDKEDTFIDGIKDVSEYIKSLEDRGTDEDSLRASRLNIKTARYFVGAQSESALSYRRLKVEDAISAAWQALNGGVVAGGGVCLRNIANSIPQGTVGASILLEALRAPFEQIAKNAGIKLKPEDYEVSNKGYDTRTRTVVDMFEANILDPANIVLNVAKNAISVGATALTAGTVVTLPREETTPQVPGMIMR